MDILVRRSGIVLRSALALICVISFGVAALFAFATVMGVHERYSEPLPLPPGHFMLDGPSHTPLTPWQWLELTGFFLIDCTMMLSAIALWRRFRRYAAIVAGLTVAFTALLVADTVMTYLEFGTRFVPEFYSVMRELIVVGWTCFVVLVLWRIGRGRRASGDAAADAAT